MRGVGTRLPWRPGRSTQGFFHLPASCLQNAVASGEKLGVCSAGQANKTSH